MSEHYFSLKIKLDNPNKGEELKAKLLEGYNSHYYEVGDTLKATLEKMFNADFMNYVFSPFYTQKDFESLLPFIKNESTAQQHWYLQEYSCQDKKHLWLGHREPEISGFNVFPEEVKSTKDMKTLTLYYPCDVEQKLIGPAFLKIAFMKYSTKTDAINEELFSGDEY